MRAASLRIQSRPSAGTEEAFGRVDRMLALSDGIFAFAITLLVLDIKVPHVANSRIPSVYAIDAALLAQWPEYFAFALSFVNVGLMWMNHLTLFCYIRRRDHTLTILNGLLLLCISINPFITSLLADYLVRSRAYTEIALTVYSGVWFVTALCFNALWFYAAYKQRLLDPRFTPQHYRDLSRRYASGPTLYFAAFAAALAGFPFVSLGISVLLSLLYAFPYAASRAGQEATTLENDVRRTIFRRGWGARKS